MTGAPGQRLARALALAVAAAGVVLALTFRMLADFDLPGHLAVGRLVVARRALLRVDDLCFTARPILHVEYVSDVLLYLVARAGGPLALQLFGGLVAVGLATLLALSGRRGGTVCLPVAGLGLAALQVWLLVRPATFSFVLLAAVMCLLERHRSGRSGLPWLVPLFLLWANTHGFVVVGLAVVAGYAGHAALCRVAGGRAGALLPSADGERAGTAAAVALASLLASFCNQAGPRYLTGPLRVLRDTGAIGEWMRATPSFMVTKAPLAAAFALLVIGALVLGREVGPDGERRRGVAAFDLGLAVLAFALAWSAVRMIPLAIVLTTPMSARRLGALVRPARSRDVALVLTTWLVAPWMWLGSPATRGIGFDPAHFSDAAIAFIENAKPRGPMLNSLEVGGWLDWRLYPEFRTFVDHRQTWVADQQTLDTYYASGTKPAAFEKLEQAYGFQWAVIYAEEGTRLALPLGHSSAWRMIYWDDVTAVYVRGDGSNAELAHRGYRVIRHLTSPEEMLETSIARDNRAKALGADGALAERQAPNSPRAAFFAGCGAIATRDRAALEASVERLARLAPGHAGIAALRAGWERAEARQGAEKAE